MTASQVTRRSRAGSLLAVCVVALGGSIAAASPATAAPPQCDPNANNSVARLLECVTVDGVRSHQRALQQIADRNGGNRASGTRGYDKSAEYVVSQAKAAGLKVRRDRFDFPFFQLNTQSVEAPVGTPLVAETDFATLTYSGSGDVTAVAQPVDLVLPPTPAPSSTSGCETADFAGFVPGNIALVQRGTCTFEVKATNAVAAGASGVIVFNEGQPGRTDAVAGTLGVPGFTIPVVGVSFAVGSAVQNTSVRLNVATISETRTTTNITAEIAGQTKKNVVMVGAHLDSVIEGPGINDNGSGTAAILEVAKQMAKTKPVNTVRFAWWGAEELGLLGSQNYVDSLKASERDRIALYLNFDMVGSPNFARFVYDGDESSFPASTVPIPLGSAEIEDVFEQFYTERDLAFEDTAFDGRSDYEAFALAGIPAGGLFTGAEGLKTDEQAARYGGTAGAAFDPNYHQAGDTFENNNSEVLGQNADAIAFSTLTFAYSTELVNGAPGSPAPLRAATVPGHAHDAAA